MKLNNYINCGIFITYKYIIAALIFSFAMFAYSSQSNASNGQVIDATGKVRITVITPSCVRIEYNDQGKFIDKPSYFANQRNNRYTDAKITKSQASVLVKTPYFSLYLKSDGKPLSVNNLAVRIYKKGGDEKWAPGKKDDANLGGATRTLDGWTNARKLPDGILSRNGWHFIDDSRGPLLSDNWVKSRPKNSGTDWYLFCYGTDYKAALKSLTAASGNIPLPRKYMLGMYYSRYWPYSSKEFRQIVSEYDHHGFPLDVMVMDMDWHRKGWTGFSWNRKLLPDAEELLKWFHQQKVYVTLNDHPADGIKPYEDCYADFMNAMGDDPSSKKVIPFDAANKKYMDAFYKYSHAVLDREGVDFWWLDWQQYPYTKSISNLTNLAWLNQIYYQKGVDAGLRGASLSRWGGWGDHRHPIHFSGDAATSFDMLAFEIPFTVTSGNSGCFFWSHDIGGHMGSRNEESYTRWCQFGAFSAALRSHSGRNKKMDRRPWKYSKQAEDSMRISFRLRAAFFPYTYSSVQNSCTESIPLIRPLYIENPNDENAYKQPQEYLYGDNILVAPVTSQGAGPQRLARQVVSFPEGAWYNYFSGERFVGGQEILTASTINEFPLYVRGGMPIPMRKFAPRVMTPLSELVIRCYPGKDDCKGSFTLYEDDGESLKYRKGDFSKTVLRYFRKGNRITVNVAPAKGFWAGQVQKRTIIVEFPCTQKASAVFVNGKPAHGEYIKKDQMNRVTVSDVSVKDGLEVSLDMADADQKYIRSKAFAQRVGLPVPDIGARFNEILTTALNNTKDSKIQKAILAAAGTGAFLKNEYPYSYPEIKKLKFYGAAKNAIVKKQKVNLEGRCFANWNTFCVSYKIFGKEYTFTEVDGSKSLPAITGNIASEAKITSTSGETAGLVDGIVDGIPNGRQTPRLGNEQKHEWRAWVKEGGACVRLRWNKIRNICKVILFDRPHKWSQVFEGHIEFSDGSTIQFGMLDNPAKIGTIISFPPKKVTWLKVAITKVHPKATKTGLSEIVVIETPKNATKGLTVTDLSEQARLSTLNIGTPRVLPYKISAFPEVLTDSLCIYVSRGNSLKPGSGFHFKVNKPVVVYMLVHSRGDFVPQGWSKTDMTADWIAGKTRYTDKIFRKDFPAGIVEIPGHSGKSKNQQYGVPHMVAIQVKK